MVNKIFETIFLTGLIDNGEKDLSAKRNFINIIKFLYLKIIPKKIKRALLLLNDPIQSINPNALIGNRFGKNFKEFFITEDMPTKLSILRNGLDVKSLNVIEQKLEHLLQLPSWGTKYQRNMRCLNRAELLYTEEQINEANAFKKILPKIKKELFLKRYFPEVVYYHHGLTLIEENIKKRIIDSVIIDCGASFGDSAAMFGRYYSPSKIISFELTDNPINAKKEFYKTINDNNLPASKFELVTKGVGEINNDNLVTLDKFLKDVSNISIIKMDIEGAALDCIKGSINIISRNRPIIIASIYHTPNEFFEIKPYIENLNLNYSFILRNLNFVTNFELETVLICLPN